jgi:hypothetical protein
MPNRALFDALREWVSTTYPGGVPRSFRLSITVPGEANEVEVRLAVPFCLPAAAAAAPPAPPPEPMIADYEPTDAELDVLAALEGVALKTKALVEAIGMSESQMFRALKRLRATSPPMVRHEPGLGYWRTDCPPAELAGGVPPGAR